jgi:hypothetical protein
LTESNDKFAHRLIRRKSFEKFSYFPQEIRVVWITRESAASLWLRLVSFDMVA